jgi:hypothetical protein
MYSVYMINEKKDPTVFYNTRVQSQAWARASEEIAMPVFRSSCRARWCDMATTTTTRVACPARPKRDYYCW